MGKAARNKEHRKARERYMIPTIHANATEYWGFTTEELELIEMYRKALWEPHTDVQRLEALLKTHEEEISKEQGEAIVADFHEGRVSYDSAVALILREVADPMLQPHFVVCDEQRLLTRLDPLPFLDSYMNPSPSTSSSAIGEVGHLLVMAHLYYSNNCFMKYRATIVATANRIMDRVEVVREALASGEVTWYQMHGQYCQHQSRDA